ncbi:MAG TPA: hypothetical protein VL551_12590 [Actinospica sp.]|jgi:hypothetical protein|nr:hypothetical protein [Actinospica sp.]
MLRKRSAAVAAAFVFAIGSPVLTAATASAIYIPWTEQTVFALGPTDNYVAEWMGQSNGWTVIGGPASEIYAGSAGVFATNPTSGDIYKYNGTPGSWTEIGGPGAQFAEGGGHLYGLAPDSSYVAEWNGTAGGWTIIGGPAGNIYAGPYGLVDTEPYGTSEDIRHYSGTPGSWTVIGGPQGFASLNDIAVGSGGVYRVNPATSAGVTVVDEWSGGTTWNPILTVGSSQHLGSLIAGDDGVYLDDVTSTTDSYLKYNGTPNSWSAISSIDYDGNGLYPMVESWTGLYGVTMNDNVSVTASTDVEIYSGTGSTWTVIGGPANPNLAAGA